MGDFLLTRSFMAGADLTGAQYCFVKLSAGKIVKAGNGQYAIGVVQDKPKQSGAGSVCRVGDVTKVVCGANVSNGDYVSSDASGNCITSVSGDEILGQALGAGSSGVAIYILYQPKGKM